MLFKAPDPIPALKRQLANSIVEKTRGWPKYDVQVMLFIEAARISNIRQGRLGRLSLQRLIRLHAQMQCDVTMHIAPSRRPILFSGQLPAQSAGRR